MALLNEQHVQADLSVLYADALSRPSPGCPAPDHFIDLALDQIVGGITASRAEYGLAADFYSPQLRPEEVYRRHDVFRDLTEQVSSWLREFSERMAELRRQMDQTSRLRSPLQAQGQHILNALGYCSIVSDIREHLDDALLESEALTEFRTRLRTYLDSSTFGTLRSDADDVSRALDTIRYAVSIRDGRVGVSEEFVDVDYGTVIEETFRPFEQGPVKDFGIKLREFPDLNHVEASILQLVGELNPNPFGTLAAFAQKHASFLDPLVAAFDRDIQFFLAYQDYIRPLEQQGLTFCYPTVTGPEGDMHVLGTFDLALADKLSGQSQNLVRNDVHLEGAERILVVSGPNQGGKTTFARTFGQLHYLAALGCPVPGTEATLLLADCILAHFERTEDLGTFSGKLEEDLVRVQQILRDATERSVVVMNEVFTSTTLLDATFLGTRTLEELITQGSRAVYVTFVDELSRLGPAVVSMVSTVDEARPPARTFHVIRRAADGRAYALSLAEQYRLDAAHLQGRIR